MPHMTDSRILLIEEAWNHREKLDSSHLSYLKPLVQSVMKDLDQGLLRVIEPTTWRLNTWIKKTILLMFKVYPSQKIPGGPWYDKIPLKGDCSEDITSFRSAPGSFIRYGAHIQPSVIVMPSFINVGAWIGHNTLIDSGVRVGSCAYVGPWCHISDNAGLGGVLEPLQDKPVIVESQCFIGASSQLVEGVHIGQGSVLGMGTMISASTRIIDRQTGEIHHGYVPPYSVVVPGSYPSSGGVNLQCAVIIKKVDHSLRQKVSPNELLRHI